jgi:type II secretory pathway component PulF
MQVSITGARTRWANWAAIRVVHSDLLTGLLLLAAVLTTLVLYLREPDSRAQWLGLIVALPWLVSLYRHRTICKPCPRRDRGAA